MEKSVVPPTLTKDERVTPSQRSSRIAGAGIERNMINRFLHSCRAYVRSRLVNSKVVPFTAWHACTPCRSSYAQSSEDAIMLAELTRLGKTQGVCVDVNANHPKRHSNTYPFYRSGLRGIVIEPADRLLELHRRLRPGDVQIKTACGD
jgi:hypothetical protein